MFRRKRRDELEEVNLLEIIPVRLAEWQKRGEQVVVDRPGSTRTGLVRLVEVLLYMLSARRIRLDPVGSYAWLQLDGERSVSDVADSLRAEFGDKVEPAEQRLGHLVRVFRREGLVGYRGWDDEVICRARGIGRRS